MTLPRLRFRDRILPWELTEPGRWVLLFGTCLMVGTLVGVIMRLGGGP